MRPCKQTVETVAAALDRNERGKSYEFCVLVGSCMRSFDNLASFQKGDHPAVSLKNCIILAL